MAAGVSSEGACSDDFEVCLYKTLRGVVRGCSVGLQRRVSLIGEPCVYIQRLNRSHGKIARMHLEALRQASLLVAVRSSLRGRGSSRARREQGLAMPRDIVSAVRVLMIAFDREIVWIREQEGPLTRRIDGLQREIVGEGGWKKVEIRRGHGQLISVRRLFESMMEEYMQVQIEAFQYTERDLKIDILTETKF